MVRVGTELCSRVDGPMCGICGVVDMLRSDPMPRWVFHRMVRRLAHRGPDASGAFFGDRAVLGHARLSVIDLATGAQPIANEDGTLWIVLNGEIYNYLELRGPLEKRGHRFSTRSDTEVLLHLYEEHGADCLPMLDGQFAFAIWDTEHRRLFLARDRFGVRPLYWTQVGTLFLFASEVKALAAHPRVTLELDPFALDQVFTFWSPLAPRTAFERIHQLPAGHFLVFDGNGVHTRRWWTPCFPAEGTEPERSPEEWAEALLDVLVRAVRLRMRADVPVGAYLSGGLDSSLTASLVRDCTDTPLHTFSIRFQDPHFDEGIHQEVMVAHLGTAHDSLTVSGEQIARTFPEVVRAVEVPILRTAPVPLHLLSDMVRQAGYKVVVTGEGADEVLAGYDIFREDKVRRFWARDPGSRLRPLLLTRLYEDIPREIACGAQGHWQRFFGRRLTETSDPFYSHRIRWENTAQIKGLFSADLKARLMGADPIAELADALPPDYARWAPLSRAQYLEMVTFLSNYLLSSQGDRVAMSHGVEARYPFLSPEVAALCANIPPRLKVRGLQEKYLLRRVASGRVPDVIRLRRKRPYRAPDSAPFFENERAAEVLDFLSETSVREAGLFDPAQVARLVQRCRMPREGRARARDDMAFVGVLSAQILYHYFVKEGGEDL